MNYCRNLLFDEKPDYAFLKRLFNNLFAVRGYLRDYKYDWTDPQRIDYNVIEEKNIPLIYGEVKGSKEKIGSSLNSSKSNSEDSFMNSEHNIYDDQSVSANDANERDDDNRAGDQRVNMNNEADALISQNKKPSIFKTYGGAENNKPGQLDDKSGRITKAKELPRKEKKDTITIEDDTDSEDDISDSDTIEESEFNNSKEDFIVRRS